MWALGISAIEMAEQYPPRWKVNPNRVIFMIVKDPAPRLADADRWKLSFQDFVAHCLQKVRARVGRASERRRRTRDDADGGEPHASEQPLGIPW